MLVKGLIHQKDMAIKTIYTSNIRPPKYMRQTLTELKGKRDRYTIIIGDFNNSLSIIGEKKQTKDQQGNRGLEHILNQLGLIDTYRILLPTPEYIFFSSAQATFSRINHTLGHKITLNKFSKIENIQNIFSNHTGMKLAINKRKIRKHTNM